MCMKSILQVVVEEEYERSQSHLKYLLVELPKITDENKRKRFLQQIDSRVKNIEFAKHCLGISGTNTHLHLSEPK